MKNKIVLVILLLACILLGYIIINNKNAYDMDGYVIHYSSRNNTYDIEVDRDYLNVIKYDVVQCIQAPCNPIRDREYKVKFTDEYKELFKELFDDKKDITIYYGDLDSSKNNLLLKIVGEEEIVDNREYEIISKDYYNSSYKRRGYIINKSSNSSSVIVAMGEKNTGGYSIRVEKVIMLENNNVQIYVSENSPGYKDVVTQAFTYPIIEVKFNFIVNDVLVQNLDTYEKYEKIG